MPKVAEKRKFYRKLKGLNKNIDCLISNEGQSLSKNLLDCETSPALNVEDNLDKPRDPDQSLIASDNENESESINSYETGNGVNAVTNFETSRPAIDDTNKDVISDGIQAGRLSNNLQNWATKWNVSQNAINDLLVTLKRTKSLEEIQELPTDARTLLHTPRVTKIKTLCLNETYCHFGIEHQLTCLFKKYDKLLLIPEKVEISINIDGVPISNSSGSCLYPILGKISNNGEIHRLFHTKVFVIGIYHGYKKPTVVNALLEDFVNEATRLINDGLVYNDTIVNFEIKNLIFDAVAKSQFLSVKGHMGYSSCTKCSEKGDMGDRGIYFPVNLNFHKRSDEEFRNMYDEGYHISHTILTNIPKLDLIKDVVLDYMHLICLGVTKKLIVTLWLFGKPPHKLPSTVIEKLSNKMISIRHCIPSEFVRKPRTFSEAKRFKATEFRQILLYTGPIVFLGVLPRDKYLNFLTLHVAIRILSSNKYEHIFDYANNLLGHFVTSFDILYGSQYISHNVHNCLHIADDVKRFGPVTNFSAFPFENYLQEIKGMIRKAENPLSQIIRRIHEKEHAWLDSTQLNNNLYQPKQEHTDGILIEGLFCNPQFKEVYINNLFKLQIKSPNDCCQIKDSDIILIRNFATCSKTKKIFIIGYKYLQRKDFYEEPINSSLLNIFIVSNLSAEIEFWDISDVTSKFMKLPYQDKEVVFPLLHNES